MSDILLAKRPLEPGFIDASYGEPYIVKKTILDRFRIKEDYNFIDEDFSYPNTTGYAPLVRLLEDKHKYPVVITNGAKQGLGAVFYALKKLNKANMYLPAPYWALIPPLAKMHGLRLIHEPHIYNSSCESLAMKRVMYDSYCYVAPNNPDGKCGSFAEIKQLAQEAKDNGVLFIHDAAYYSRSYIDGEYNFDEVIGDAQIFSVSKLFGLSGLRLGYVVCKNLEIYSYVQEYIEMMTVGVSVIPQIFLNDLLSEIDYFKNNFETEVFNALRRNKLIISQINPDVLDTTGVVDSYGMFGWFKLGPKVDFNKAKIKIVPGDLFGCPGYARINLAFDEPVISEIVKRLNDT